MLPNLLKSPNRIISGRTAFKLYDTYGYPIELTKELAAEHGFEVDEKGFHEAFAKHQELSRAGGDQTFKGGLADHSDRTTALHTATHLLHQALRRLPAITSVRKDRISPSNGSGSISPIPSR